MDDEFDSLPPELQPLNLLLAWEPVSITYDTEVLEYPRDEDGDLDWDGAAEMRGRIASELQTEIGNDVEVAAEQPEPPGHFAIGPQPQDTVWLVIHALEVYAAIDVAAARLAQVISWVRERAKKPVQINASGAELLAWKAVRETGNYKKVERLYVAPLHVQTGIPMFLEPDGWLFSFKTDRSERAVVVRRDGEVLGSSPAPDESMARSLKRHRRKRGG